LIALVGGAAFSTSEVAGISHPVHQVIVLGAAVLTGAIGYFTYGPGQGSPAGVGEAGPPYSIPSPLPIPSSPAARSSPASSRASIDAAAAAAAQAPSSSAKQEQGLP
jgi:hypothetical protein